MQLRKKKLIWWEREPTATGSDEARVRGSHEDGGRHGGRTSSPYYGPVTVAQDDEDTELGTGLVTG
jgi:hypothetical protein